MASDMPEKEVKQSQIVRYLPVIIAVVAVLYGLGAYFLLFMPKIGQLMAGGALDSRALAGRLSDYQEYLDQITAEKEKFTEVNSAHLRKIPLMLPEWADAPNLFVQMDAVARENGLVLTSIDTVPDEGPVGIDGVKRVRISLSLLGGTFQEFNNFLGGLEKLVRISDIDSLTFSSGDTSYSVILTAYFIAPEVAPAQAVQTGPPTLPEKL